MPPEPCLQSPTAVHGAVPLKAVKHAFHVDCAGSSTQRQSMPRTPLIRWSISCSRCSLPQQTMWPPRCAAQLSQVCWPPLRVCTCSETFSCHYRWACLLALGLLCAQSVRLPSGVQRRHFHMTKMPRAELRRGCSLLRSHDTPPAVPMGVHPGKNPAAVAQAHLSLCGLEAPVRPCPEVLAHPGNKL